MATTFAVVPTWVEPEEPDFSVIITQSDGMKKQYQALSDTPIIRFKLMFENISDTSFWTIYNHYSSCTGPYASFVWATVPSYIDTDQDGTPDGSNLTGRWVKGTFKPRVNAKTFGAEITFEKAIS